MESHELLKSGLGAYLAGEIVKAQILLSMVVGLNNDKDTHWSPGQEMIV